MIKQNFCRDLQRYGMILTQQTFYYENHEYTIRIIRCDKIYYRTDQVDGIYTNMEVLP